MKPYPTIFKTFALASCLTLVFTAPFSQATAKRNSHSYKLDDDSVFNKILAKYKGKVVYVDLWAPWCVPCMQEIPSVKALADSLKSKNVAFVFFCVNAKDEERDATIAKLKLPGDHYSLNARQYTSLRDGFGFTGIPHYFLVNKSGKITDRDAKRADQKGVKDDILKLVKN